MTLNQVLARMTLQHIAIYLFLLIFLNCILFFVVYLCLFAKSNFLSQQKLSLLHKIASTKYLETFSCLAWFPFTRNEIGLDYYQERVNVKISSRVAEQVKIYDLRKLASFKKIPEMLWIKKQVTSWPQKIKILKIALQNAKNQL